MMTMKRLIACLLAAMLVLSATVASAATSYTLTEKIGLQMDGGSGMKGSMTISAEGDADWAKTIAAIASGDYQLRAIKSGEGYYCELYAAEGEAKTAVTKVYLTDATAEIVSEFLPGIPVTLAHTSPLFEMILGGSKAGNPTWYTAAANILGVSDSDWDSLWAPVLESYFTDIEVWMLNYSAAPVIGEDENGETVLEMRYEIPLDAVADQIIVLLNKVLADETLMALLREQMSEEQLALYLSPELLYHYENVLNALPITGSISMSRTVTTLGVDIASSITLPLPANEDGWQSLQIVDQAGSVVYTAVSPARTVALGVGKEDAEDGVVTTITWKDIPAELSAESMAASWKMTVHEKIEERVDEDTRAHEITTWTVDFAQDLSHLAEDDASRELYKPYEAVSGVVTLHLSSKNSNNSPTTAALDVDCTIGESRLTLSGQIKTASPWIVESWTSVTGEEITTMEESRLTELWDTFRKNAADALSAQ